MSIPKKYKMADNDPPENESPDERNLETLNIQSIDSKGGMEIPDDDDNEMDFSRHLPQPDKSNNRQAGINLFKSFIGIGILSIPYTFERSGYIAGVFILLFVGSMANYTSLLLIQIPERTNCNDAYRIALGRKGVIVYRIFVIVLQVGVCIAYIIFFTEYFRNAFSKTNLPDNKIIYGIFSLIIVFPLSLISNFHMLYKFSIAGSIFCVVTLLAVTEYSAEVAIKAPQNPPPLVFEGIGYTIGMMVLAFEAIGTIMTVRESMQEPSDFSPLFSKVLFMTIGIYCVFGFVCVWGLGEGIHPIVFIGLENKRSYFYIFQVFYSFAIIFSYPVQLFPALFYIDKIGFLKNLYEKSRIYWYGTRFIVTLILFAVALGVPSFATFVNFLGSLCGTTLQFVFPTIAYYKVFGKEMNSKEKAKLLGAFLLGIFISLYGMAHSIVEFSI